MPEELPGIFGDTLSCCIYLLILDAFLHVISSDAHRGLKKQQI